MCELGSLLNTIMRNEEAINNRDCHVDCSVRSILLYYTSSLQFNNLNYLLLTDYSDFVTD